MRKFLQTDERVRRLLLQQVSEEVGLAPKSIEKDLWVTQVLHALFSLPVSDKLIFKGGTSLSKAWGLIDRFNTMKHSTVLPTASERKAQMKALQTQCLEDRPFPGKDT